MLEAFSVRREDVEAELERIRTGGTPTPSDAEALATLGIDLDEVRRQVEEAFGPGALERTRRPARRRRWLRRATSRSRKDAKKVLELALREAMRLKHNYIGSEHILLGMLHARRAPHDDPRRARGHARRHGARRGRGGPPRRRTPAERLTSARLLVRPEAPDGRRPTPRVAAAVVSPRAPRPAADGKATRGSGERASRAEPVPAISAARSSCPADAVLWISQT